MRRLDQRGVTTLEGMEGRDRGFPPRLIKSNSGEKLELRLMGVEIAKCSTLAYGSRIAGVLG